MHGDNQEHGPVDQPHAAYRLHLAHGKIPPELHILWQKEQRYTSASDSSVHPKVIP